MADLALLSDDVIRSRKENAPEIEEEISNAVRKLSSSFPNMEVAHIQAVYVFYQRDLTQATEVLQREYNVLYNNYAGSDDDDNDADEDDNDDSDSANESCSRIEVGKQVSQETTEGFAMISRMDRQAADLVTDLLTRSSSMQTGVDLPSGNSEIATTQTTHNKEKDNERHQETNGTEMKEKESEVQEVKGLQEVPREEQTKEKEIEVESHPEIIIAAVKDSKGESSEGEEAKETSEGEKKQEVKESKKEEENESRGEEKEGSSTRQKENDHSIVGDESRHSTEISSPKEQKPSNEREEQGNHLAEAVTLVVMSNGQREEKMELEEKNLRQEENGNKQRPSSDRDDDLLLRTGLKVEEPTSSSPPLRKRGLTLDAYLLSIGAKEEAEEKKEAQIDYDIEPQRTYLRKADNFDLVEQFVVSGYRVTEVDRVVDSKLATRFIRRWKKFKKKYGNDSAESQSVIGFYTFDSNTLQTIIKKGFSSSRGYQKNAKSPGGRLYGKGVHLGIDPKSCAKGVGAGNLLVVAALPGRISYKGGNHRRYDSVLIDNIRVMYRGSQVLPLYMVAFHDSSLQNDQVSNQANEQIN